MFRKKKKVRQKIGSNFKKKNYDCVVDFRSKNNSCSKLKENNIISVRVSLINKKVIICKNNLKKLNKHINFERESVKGNARKWPTEVMCIKCNKSFILPFKPRDPEVYCDDCFKIIRQIRSKNIYGKKLLKKKLAKLKKRK